MFQGSTKTLHTHLYLHSDKTLEKIYVVTGKGTRWFQISAKLVCLCFVQDALKGKAIHKAFPEAQELYGKYVVCVTFLLNRCFGHFRKTHLLTKAYLGDKRSLRERLGLQEEVNISMGVLD